MIVVAIIGILSTLAVFAYRKVTGSAEVETEIAAIFAELRVRQEEYHAEEGTYLSTGADESGMFPPGAPVAPGEAPIDISPLLAAADGTGATPVHKWALLRMRPRKSQLRCAYVSIAGPGGGGSIGGIASGNFNMTVVPESNWYYLIARCDADGDSGTDSFYFARHDHEGMAVKDKGK
jgi:Tfp pilus assembly protein PilE